MNVVLLQGNSWFGLGSLLPKGLGFRLTSGTALPKVRSGCPLRGDGALMLEEWKSWKTSSVEVVLATVFIVVKIRVRFVRIGLGVRARWWVRACAGAVVFVV